ncbi:MAG: hypothetical protein FJX76_22710 [Armatimonadetes bacterium]|nr:hypothetical protein [Armatimonadota bacterium]
MTRRLLTIALLLGLCAAGQAAEPGSKDDPIITRSYLENLHSWQVTNLQDGQTLSLDMGVTFVLRSGKAAVVGVGAEGLVDLTAGRELKDGEKIVANHLMLSPASDRRGLRAQSSVVLLTRGLTR